MNRFAFFLAATVLGAAPAYSQEQRPDHLLPEDSILSGGESMFFARYYALVSDVLAEGFDRNVTLRAVVLPSFSPEYLVGLRDMSMTGGTGFQVFYLRPTTQLWDYESLRMMQTGEVRVIQGSKPTDDLGKIQAEEMAVLKARLPATPKAIPLDRCERPLEAATAKLVSAAWIGVLSETRYTPPETVIGLDGGTYHFSGHLQGEAYAGEVWTPDPATKPGMLAGLAESMMRYCDGKATASILEHQAEAILKRLRR